MGAFNRLYFDSTCPNCAYVGESIAEIKLGSLEQDDYRVGDTLDWVGTRRLLGHERPELGNIEDFGYVVCPSCEEGFWVWVTVERDKITRVEPSPGPDPFDRDVS